MGINHQSLLSYLVVLWVEEFGQLVEDEAGVIDRASEDVVDRSAEVVGGQDGVGRREPRPHDQDRVRGVVQLAVGDGQLQLPEGVADEGQRLALHAQPRRDVVGARRQHHVVGQQGEGILLWNCGAIWKTKRTEEVTICDDPGAKFC